MEPMSRSERAALCNTALETGEAAATLCEGWSVKDLVIHLLVRERDPLAAPGILAPPLAGLTRFAERRLDQQDFTALVERVRSGPPLWSPMKVGPVDRTFNTAEYFVHHEDIRRAQPGWQPRELTEREQKILWKVAAGAGKALVRKAGVPVRIAWRDRSATLVRGEDPVVLTGPPAEITMYLFGREQVSGLDVDGPPGSVAALHGSGGL